MDDHGRAGGGDHGRDGGRHRRPGCGLVAQLPVTSVRGRGPDASGDGPDHPCVDPHSPSVTPPRPRCLRPPPPPAVLASTPVAPSAPAPPPPPPATATTTPPTAPPPPAPALPAYGQATAWGCSAALAYLQAYAAPGFALHRPGYAEGHEAMPPPPLDAPIPGCLPQRTYYRHLRSGVPRLNTNDRRRTRSFMTGHWASSSRSRGVLRCHSTPSGACPEPIAGEADGTATSARRALWTVVVYRRRVESDGSRPLIRPVRPDELALLPALEAAADTMFEPLGIRPLPGPGTVEEFGRRSGRPGGRRPTGGPLPHRRHHEPGRRRPSRPSRAALGASRARRPWHRQGAPASRRL